jgi:hypothetical protein
MQALSAFFLESATLEYYGTLDVCQGCMVKFLPAMIKSYCSGWLCVDVPNDLK